MDFSLYRSLAPRHQPQVRLEQAIRELKEGLAGMRFDDRDFRSSQFMRLKVLERHIAEGRLGDDLVWKAQA